MKEKSDSKGVVYTVKRTYKGTYTVDELIDRIIQSHYIERGESSTEEREEHRTA